MFLGVRQIDVYGKSSKASASGGGQTLNLTKQLIGEIQSVLHALTPWRQEHCQVRLLGSQVLFAYASFVVGPPLLPILQCIATERRMGGVRRRVGSFP